MELADREILLSSMKWPAEVQKMCLQCNIAMRRRFSWFCRKECEDAYVEEHNEQ